MSGARPIIAEPPLAGESAGKGNLACFVAMVMWAAGFPAAETLLDTWGEIALIAVRLGFGAVVLILFWFALEGRAALSAGWRRGLIVGAVGFGGGATLLLVGQSLSGPVTTAIAAAMTPIAGAILEFVFDARRPTAPVLFGVVCAVAGGLIATGAKLDEGQFGLGAAICLASVFVFSWGTRETTRIAGLSSLGRTAVTSVGAVLFCAALWIGAATLDLATAWAGSTDPFSLAMLCIYALIAFAGAQLLWLWGAGRLGILLASLHMNAVPFYVMIAVIIAFGAEWSWMQAGGAALVGFGVIASQTQPRNWRRRRRETLPR